MKGPLYPDEDQWREIERLLADAFHSAAPEANEADCWAAAWEVGGFAALAAEIEPPKDARRLNAALSHADAAMDELLAAIKEIGFPVQVTEGDRTLFARFRESIEHRLVVAEATLAAISHAGSREPWRGPPGVRPSRLRAAVVADFAAKWFAELAGREPTITRPTDGALGQASGHFMLLLARSFLALGISAGVEGQARGAIRRRKRMIPGDDAEKIRFGRPAERMD